MGLSKLKEPNHLNLVERYFDQHAQSWQGYYQAKTGITEAILIERKDLAVGYLQDRLAPGAKILDAGCGAGITAVELARRGFRVEGIDISENMIRLSRENLAGSGLNPETCSFRIGDILSDPIAPGQFDAVVALGFLQYQADELASLGRMYEVLKPGGLLILSGPVKIKISNYFGLLDLLRRMLRRKRAGREDLLHRISINYYSPRRFKLLLTASGFQFHSYRGHGFIHFEIISRKIGFGGQLLLHRLFTALARVLPLQRFANDMVVVAVRPAT